MEPRRQVPIVSLKCFEVAFRRSYADLSWVAAY